MSAVPRAAFLFAVALAACGKGAGYTPTDVARGIPAQSERPGPDAGGQDGGSDGGTLPDGGPITCGPSRADLEALDGCATGNPPLIASQAALIRSACNDALFFVSTTGTTCTGGVAGPLNVFAGQCQIANGNILDCGAPNGILPGVITCLPNNCTIRVCIVQGQDGGC
jgi:hypothetical protein